MAVDFTLTDDQLASANLGALTAGLSTLEKVEWAYIYTHRSANRQGQLVRMYQAGTLGYLGYDVDLPPATIYAIKAEVNALADRILIAQGVVADATD